MKVKIISSAKPNYWYVHHIGETFEVFEDTEENTYCFDGEGGIRYHIEKGDCEIVEEG